MSSLQLDILQAVEQIYRTTHAPARTVAVAQRCFISERWALYKLNELAVSGRLKRVAKNKGWLPLAAD